MGSRLRGWEWMAGIILLMVLAPAWGQPPTDFGERMRQEMEALRKQYRYNFMLRDTFLKIIEMEKQGKAPLTPEQARKLLDIIGPLRKKERLKSTEAKEAAQRIQGVLTARQLQVLSTIKVPEPPRGRFGGGGGGPQGGGPPGGGNFDPQRALQRMRERFRDFNPFYVPEKPNIPPDASPEQAQRMKEFHERRKKTLQEQLSVLEKKAAAKPAPATGKK